MSKLAVARKTTALPVVKTTPTTALQRQLSPADEAILWVARLVGLSPTEHHILLAVVTKFEVRRNAHGPGWVVAASWTQVCEKADISRGKLSAAMPSLKRFIEIDKGNIHGDSNVWVLPGGASSQNEPDPPSSENELVHKMNHPSSRNEHKSRRHSPSTNSPNLKHGSLLPQEESAAPEDSSPEGSRSLGQSGEREKITPEILRKVTASLHATLRKHVQPDSFRGVWSRTRVVGLNFKHFTVECPPELIQGMEPQNLEAFLAEIAAQSGHLRERQVRLLVGKSPGKSKSPTKDKGAVFWPVKQPDLKAVELWDRLMKRLQPTIHKQSYDTWFVPGEPLKLKGHTLYVGVPNPFFQDWLSDHIDVVLECAKLEGAPNLNVVWIAKPPG